MSVQLTSCTWMGMLMACRKYHMMPAVKMMPCGVQQSVSGER